MKIHRDSPVPRSLPASKASPRLAAVLCGVFLTLSACSEKEPVASSPARPGIRFDSTEVDLGTIAQFDRVSHVFRFESVGTAPVRITGVKTTCACTIPKYTRDPLPPGASGTLEVLFEPGSRSGKIEKDIKVSTDDPEHPSLQLVLRCFVRREFWIQPSRIVLESLRPGVPVGERTFRIQWVPELNLHVTSVESTHPSIRILSRQPFEDAETRGEDVTLTVEDWERALEETKTTAFTHFVVVKTDHPKYPQTTVPVTGGKFEPVEWSPKVLMLGVVSAAAGVEKTVQLSTPRGIDLEITGFEAPDFIEMSVDSTDRGDISKPGTNRTVVKIKILPTAPPGPFRETLKIETNLVERPEIQVYIYGQIE